MNKALAEWLQAQDERLFRLERTVGWLILGLVALVLLFGFMVGLTIWH